MDTDTTTIRDYRPESDTKRRADERAAFHSGRLPTREQRHSWLPWNCRCGERQIWWGAKRCPQCRECRGDCEAK